MRLFFLAILISSRAGNSGPLNFGDSTFSEPVDSPILDGGNTADTGQVRELPLQPTQSNQVGAFSNSKANILSDYQILDSTNDASPNLLADLSVAQCLDGDSQGKGSAKKNAVICPARSGTSPSEQSTEEGRDEHDSVNKPNPNQKQDDQPILNINSLDNICEPPKKLFCCFGREVVNWNSRQSCEECMLPFYTLFMTVSLGI